MTWNRSGLVLLVVFAVAGCRHLGGSLTGTGEIKREWRSADDERFIRARGIGAAPVTAKDETQRRGMARNAALVNARYELLARVHGVKLDGGVTVSELVQTDASIQERADALIRGAEEVATEWSNDGGAVVILQIERAEVQKLGRGR